MADPEVLLNRTKSSGVLVRTDVPGWEADIRDRGHRLGFVIRIGRSGQLPVITFRTSSEARWPLARRYASELIKLVGAQSDRHLQGTSGAESPEGEGGRVAKALEKALSERDDLDRYGSAKRTLFALQLMLDLEDIHTVAATALTDGPDDKSCDVVYVDRDARTIVIAQGYESARPRVQAPQTKAASLHEAVNWLLGAPDETTVPRPLRSAWKEVHDALADEAIDDVEIWFVHNLPESSQVGRELNAAADATYRLLSSRYPGHPPSVVGKEVGSETLRSRYEGSRTPILVTETFIIDVSGSFIEQGDNWSALCTSIPASWLQQQFARYKEKLFSANVRGYLGSKKSQTNINNGIRETILNSPRRF